MVCGVRPYINLRVKTLIQFRQRFREGQAVAVKQILMLLVLFREHIQQHGVRFTYVHVQTYAVHLAKRYVLQPWLSIRIRFCSR